MGRAKTVTRRWGYLDDAQSLDCDCGTRERQTIAHLLSCRLLYETCTADDLATVTDRAKARTHKWEKIVRRTRQKKKLHPHISPCWHGPPLVYINDIANVSNIFKINLFADYTSLFHTHDNFESLITETNQ